MDFGLIKVHDLPYNKIIFRIFDRKSLFKKNPIDHRIFPKIPEKTVRSQKLIVTFTLQIDFQILKLYSMKWNNLIIFFYVISYIFFIQNIVQGVIFEKNR